MRNKPKKEEVDNYFNFMINEYKKLNPNIEILEKYVGIKNEISSKGNRNYLSYKFSDTKTFVRIRKFTLALAWHLNFIE